MKKPLTYMDAGVDIDKGNAFVKTVKDIAGQTPRSGVMAEIGGFGALYSPNLSHIERPVLVSSTDGVGTKLKIAFLMNKHDTVGIDLVAMCVNDIAVQGAKPLFFLDYISMGKLNPDTGADIIRGIAAGCSDARCSLIGGETAEMPGFYAEGEYDMAGFVVGLADDSKIIDGSGIRVGHQVVAIPSSGLHCNGYSLARKICFELLNLDVNAHIPELDKTLGEELLAPTRIYSELIQTITRDLPIHGLAHITGGGLTDNIARILPQACSVALHKDSWDVLPVFTFLKKAGNISETEMMRTFNNGIGLTVIVPEEAAKDLLERLRAMDENAHVIGEVIERKSAGERVVWT